MTNRSPSKGLRDREPGTPSPSGPAPFIEMLRFFHRAGKFPTRSPVGLLSIGTQLYDTVGKVFHADDTAEHGQENTDGENKSS